MHKQPTAIRMFRKISTSLASWTSSDGHTPLERYGRRRITGNIVTRLVLETSRYPNLAGRRRRGSTRRALHHDVLRKAERTGVHRNGFVESLEHVGLGRWELEWRQDQPGLRIDQQPNRFVLVRARCIDMHRRFGF